MQIRHLTGEAIREHSAAIARLRIRVFREYPYCYEGNEDYERHYLTGLIEDKQALVLVAEEAGEIVAAATSLPLMGPADITAAAVPLFRGAQEDPTNYYYFSEILVLPPYRQRGIAGTFYRKRMQFAQDLGYRHLCFAAVINQAPKPAGYFDPTPLWHKLGFTPRPELVIDYSWPTRQGDGRVVDQVHQLMFWTGNGP